MTQTSADLSSDALRAIKARRAAAGAVAAKVPGRSATSPLATVGLKSFVDWFNEHRKDRGIVMSTQSMLNVQPALSSRFCIGILGQRFFIAIPNEFKEWFVAMPWLHLVINSDFTAISLVSRRVSSPEINFPAFALNFPFDGAATLKMMANYHFIDIRLILSKGVEPNEIRVARDVLLTLDSRVVLGGEFHQLLDGRNPDAASDAS